MEERRDKSEMGMGRNLFLVKGYHEDDPDILYTLEIEVHSFWDLPFALARRLREDFGQPDSRAFFPIVVERIAYHGRPEWYGFLSMAKWIIIDCVRYMSLPEVPPPPNPNGESSGGTSQTE